MTIGEGKQKVCRVRHELDPSGSRFSVKQAAVVSITEGISLLADNFYLFRNLTNGTIS
jgi:hypothetical protein